MRRKWFRTGELELKERLVEGGGLKRSAKVLVAEIMVLPLVGLFPSAKEN